MLRLRAEHPDDDTIENDRVKGKLKVTRAFGAGFLKQVKNVVRLHVRYDQDSLLA